MPYDEGSGQYVAHKKEAVYNVAESGSGSTILRRVSFEMKLAKPEVESQEKRDDFQEVSVNHGSRTSTFTLQGELFGGDYVALLGAAMRRAFTGSTTVSTAMTIASGVLTRATGSFITDGVKVGDIRRLALMTTAGNLNRNVRVTAMAADGLTCNIRAVDGGDPIADDAGPNASSTFAMPGKSTFVASTGHTSDTFTFEKYSRKGDTSKLSWGNKIGSFEISAQPDQPAQITFTGVGKNRRNVKSGSAPVLTSPTAAGTGPAMSTAIGEIRIAGNVVGAVTGFSYKADAGVSGLPVVYANETPDVFYGRALVNTGQITFAKENDDVSDLFDEETEAELDIYIAAPGSDPQAFVSIYCGRVKFNTDDETDPDGPVIVTAGFRALKRTSGVGHNLTVMTVQDSSAA